LAGSATDLIYLDPAAPFMSSLHLAFFSPAFSWPRRSSSISSGNFVMPALKIKEKKYFLPRLRASA